MIKCSLLLDTMSERNLDYDTSDYDISIGWGKK